jgi:penicillin-binding protein 1C
MPLLAPHSTDQSLATMKNTPVIQLTLDSTIQAALEQLARDRAIAQGPDVSIGILAVDNETGDVIAHVGSSDYFDVKRAGQVDMTRAVRSPGSTLKPFIYGLAFEDGFVHPEPDRGPARSLRRLRAGKFRHDLSGYGDRSQGAADVAERAGHRAA